MKCLESAICFLIPPYILTRSVRVISWIGTIVYALAIIICLIWDSVTFTGYIDNDSPDYLLYRSEDIEKPVSEF